MKKAIIAIVALMAVLAVIYLAGSWYFSGLIVKFTPRALEQRQSRARHAARLWTAHRRRDHDPRRRGSAGRLVHHQPTAGCAMPAPAPDRLGRQHAASIDDDFAAYQAQFDEFLSVFVSGFGPAVDAQ